jgi:cephalosporin-C deacetylase-like acetyl esterase
MYSKKKLFSCNFKKGNTMDKFKRILFAVSFVIAICANARPAKPVEGYLLKVKTSKPQAVFKVNEKFDFEISLVRKGKLIPGKEISYTITREGKISQQGKITSENKAVKIKAFMERPGFMLCRAEFTTKSGKKVIGYGGTGIDPLKIKAAKVSDKDIKAVYDFWDSKIKKLNSLPLKVKMIPDTVDEAYTDKLKCFDIRVNCLGDKDVSGYLVMPANAKPKSLPAYVGFHGAGVRSSHKRYDIAMKGALALNVNAHGIENGKPKEFYDKLKSGKLKGYPLFGSNDPEKSYFCGMMMRVYRALQFIKSRPEWDGKTLITYGSSQGGGQSLFAAASDSDVTFAVARVPALCNHYGLFKNDLSGWPKFIKLKNGKPVDPQVVKTAKYFDMALLAPRIKAEMLLTAGFIDRTCSPSSVYSAYNAINSKKQIIHNIKYGHYNPPETSSKILEEIYSKLDK